MYNNQRKSKSTKIGVAHVLHVLLHYHQRVTINGPVIIQLLLISFNAVSKLQDETRECRPSTFNHHKHMEKSHQFQPPPKGKQCFKPWQPLGPPAKKLPTFSGAHM